MDCGSFEIIIDKAYGNFMAVRNEDLVGFCVLVNSCDRLIRSYSDDDIGPRPILILKRAAYFNEFSECSWKVF